MPHVSIGDAEIYYEEQGQGPALMLVPGLGGQGAFWGPQMRDFSRDFRVIVHDHRGAGRSTHSRIQYSVDQMAADTVALMDRLGVDRAHYVGHSTGGAIGQTIAQDHPDRLGSLVLSATWAGQDAYFRRCFETRKELLLHRGFESYWRASVVMLRPSVGSRCASNVSVLRSASWRNGLLTTSCRLPKNTSSASTVTVPDSIFERSRMSLMSVSRSLPDE